MRIKSGGNKTAAYIQFCVSRGRRIKSHRQCHYQQHIMTPSKTLFLLFLFIFISCSSGDKTNEAKPQINIPTKDTSKIINRITQSDKQFEETWKIFANAVLSGNLNKVKQLSTNCIECSDCVTNTPKEDSLFNDFEKKNPNTWYEKLYSELSYIPIDKFLKEDFTIIFDSFTKTRLLDSSKIRFHDDEVNKGMYDKKCIISSNDLKNAKLLEMFVKVVDPSTETEGMDKAFAFIQTKQGYKFCGYSTIP